MLNELKRNASGYYDPTAYEAIRKVDGEMKLNPLNPGEVWEIMMGNGNTYIAAILNTNDNIISCVPLFESRRNDYEVEVKANGIMYANTAMVKYEYSNRFSSFIRIMKEEEFAQMRESVLKCLGFDGCGSCEWDEAAIELSNEQKAEIHRLKEQLEEKIGTINVMTKENMEMRKNLDDQADLLKKFAEENESLNKSIKESVEMPVKLAKGFYKVEAERDTYKSLYEQTLERLIKAV